MSVNDFDADSFVMFPNPCKNTLTIKSNSNNKTQVSIIDVLGRLVYTVEKAAEKIELNTTNYSSGTYFVKVSQNNKNIIKKLIIK